MWRAELIVDLLRRLAEPVEFGSAWAFLYSAPAGNIPGQRVRIDGGAFPGVL